MASNIDKTAFPEPTPRVLDIEKCDGFPIFEGENSSKVRSLVKTSDMTFLVDGPRDPGESLSWHVHMPDLYQVAVVIDGEIRFHYRTEDDEEKHVDLEPGQIAYLPGGMENKIEIIGDEPAYYFVFEPNVTPNRVEHLLGDDSDVYPPGGIPWGLNVDTVNNRVVEVQDEALVDY